MAFHDLGNAADMLGKGAEDVVGRAIEHHFDEDHQRLVELLGVEQRGIARDHAALAQPLHAVEACGGGHAAELGQRLVGDSTVLLQDPQQPAVSFVDLNKLRIRSGHFQISSLQRAVI